jgi:hypothetical protein
LPKPLCGRSGPATLASIFTDFRVVCFPLAGVLNVNVSRGRPLDHPLMGRHYFNAGLTTLLSIALRRCRPTASSVWMLPLSLQVGQYSPVSPGLLSMHPLLRASLSPELCRLSSITRFPPTDFQPRGSQGPHRPGDVSGFVTRRMLGMHTTPVGPRGRPLEVLSRNCASWPPTILCQESHPARRFRGRSKLPCCVARPIEPCSSPDRPVLSRAPAPRWARYRY